jgi:HlyD family secretion protein
MVMKKAIIWVVVLVVIAAGGVFGYRYREAHKTPAVQYETAKVDRGRITATVTATGTLSALVTVQVGTQVSGRLKDILVDFNSPVKKGQVLARIDPQLFQASLAQARANHAAAKGDLAAAQVKALDGERQYTRAKSLGERKLIAQADLDTAQATYESAKAQVDSAQGRVEQMAASLNQAQVNLAFTTITSPIDGIVVSRSVDVGQTVAASLSAPTLFVLAEDLAKMQVDASVAEADIGKLSAGMNARFTVDAYPSDKFKGKVRQIRNSPTTVQNVVTYDAVIDVDNAELKLKPGMTANITFIYAEKNDAVRVPNAALRFKPPTEIAGPAASGEADAGVGGQRARGQRQREPSDKRTVWVLRGTTPTAVQIQTGVTDGTMTEAIGEAIREGDVVITDSTGGTQSTSTSAPGGQPPPGGMRRLF